MSQAPGGKKPGKGPPKKAPVVDEDKNAPAKTEEKDETASNNGEKKETKDAKETGGADVPKPPSAGVNMREVASKVLMLAQKGEWPAVEQTLKALEKLVAAGGDDAVTVPMAGILDPGDKDRAGKIDILVDYMELITVTIKGEVKLFYPGAAKELDLACVQSNRACFSYF
ncbi:unnamed protein product [Diatraea saccharalis]|uniref:Uncharacterized protein n=1 Tax=Diatraea saccharalis TaxID=40085 RepID=A0A9N9QXR8_9NEOP|nr:unnamed protein product [Diatraea saccharalis]